MGKHLEVRSQYLTFPSTTPIPPSTWSFPLQIRREKQRLADEAAKKKEEEEERKRRKQFEAHAVKLRDEAKRYQEQKAAREKARLEAERKVRAYVRFFGRLFLCS